MLPKNNSTAIPISFFLIPYNGKVVPGEKLPALSKRQGANCQVFVYNLLEYMGVKLPQYLRSSDLWEDKSFSEQVEKPLPFDILFFNTTNTPYGAHLGMYLGDNKVIHLSKQVGFPTIWSVEQFAQYESYKTLIGIKRIIVKR